MQPSSLITQITDEFTWGDKAILPGARPTEAPPEGADAVFDDNSLSLGINPIPRRNVAALATFLTSVI